MMEEFVKIALLFSPIAIGGFLAICFIMYLDRVHIEQTVKMDIIGFFIVETRVLSNRETLFYVKSDPIRAEKLDEVIANHKESAKQFMDIIKRHKL